MLVLPANEKCRQDDLRRHSSPGTGFQDVPSAKYHSSISSFLSRIRNISETLHAFDRDILDSLQPLIASEILHNLPLRRSCVVEIQESFIVTPPERQLSSNKNVYSDDSDSEDEWQPEMPAQGSGDSPDTLSSFYQSFPSDGTAERCHKDFPTKLIPKLNKFVSTMENQMAAMLQRVQAAVDHAVSRHETQRRQCLDVERKEGRQRELIEEMEEQLLEAKQDLQNQLKVQRLIETLQAENDELREELKLSRQSINLMETNDAVNRKQSEKISDLRETVRQLQDQLSGSERRPEIIEIIQQSPVIEPDVPPIVEVPKCQEFEDYILMKCKRMAESNSIIETDRLYQLLCSPSLEEDLDKYSPTDKTSLQQEEKISQLEGLVNSLTEQLKILDQERDQIAMIANRQLSQFESDIQLLVTAEIEHLRQDHPPMAVVNWVAPRLSASSQTVLNNAMASHSALTSRPSRSNSIESSSGRKPRRLYRYRLQNYV